MPPKREGQTDASKTISIVRSAMAQGAFDGELEGREIAIRGKREQEKFREFQAHPLSDDEIDRFWPEMASPEGRAEIRRQFDAATQHWVKP